MTANKHFFLLTFAFLAFSLTACNQASETSSSPIKKLNILGLRSLNEQGDTVYHKIDNFQFTNQNNQSITRPTFEGKIYVADFFFINCPTICPTMTKQMLRVHKAFKDNPQIMLLSHSIDFKNDSVPALKEYANRLEVSADKWHFVTGKREEIYDVAKTKYYMSAQIDPLAPGGYLHNSKFILVDRKGRIRGYYTGTEPTDVDQLIQDIGLLLAEKE